MNNKKKLFFPLFNYFYIFPGFVYCTCLENQANCALGYLYYKLDLDWICKLAPFLKCLLIILDYCLF